MIGQPEGIALDLSTSALRITRHAALRQAQRSLANDQLTFLLENSSVLNRTGCDLYVLGRKDIPAEFRANDRYAKLVGCVVIADGNSIITAYRADGPHPQRELAKKAKYRTPSRMPRGECFQWA